MRRQGRKYLTTVQLPPFTHFHTSGNVCGYSQEIRYIEVEVSAKSQTVQLRSIGDVFKSATSYISGNQGITHSVGTTRHIERYFSIIGIFVQQLIVQIQ